MRTKENVRSLLERLLVLPLSWHVSMGSCGLETKRCCLAKPLNTGASWEPQPAPRVPQLDGELLFREGCCCQAHLEVDFSKEWSRSPAFPKSRSNGLSADSSWVEAASTHTTRADFWGEDVFVLRLHLAFACTQSWPGFEQRAGSSLPSPTPESRGAAKSNIQLQLRRLFN